MSEPRRSTNEYASPIPTGAWVAALVFLVLVTCGQWYGLRQANGVIAQQAKDLDTYKALQGQIEKFKAETENPASLCAQTVQTQKEQLELLQQCTTTAGKTMATLKVYREKLEQCEQKR